MRKLIYISSQPDHVYFAWQLEVQFLNFLELGIPLEDYHVVVGLKSEQISQQFQELSTKYPQVKWGFVQDIRKDKSYIPSIKPHLVGQYLKQNPQYTTSVYALFYMDGDVIFKEKLQLDHLLEDDICYMSNTNSYINSTYIKSKGDELLTKMCEVVGVTREEVESINNDSGGAQYILKDLPLEYWEKTELDSVLLHKYMIGSKQYFANKWAEETKQPVEKYHPIQSWCAEMWATLWVLLYFKKKVKVIKELDFCFATSTVKEYENCKILHNAGVTKQNDNKMFFKGAYINGLPNSLDLSYVSDQHASFYYAKYVSKLVELRKNP